MATREKLFQRKLLASCSQNLSKREGGLGLACQILPLWRHNTSQIFRFALAGGPESRNIKNHPGGQKAYVVPKSNTQTQNNTFDVAPHTHRCRRLWPPMISHTHTDPAVHHLLAVSLLCTHSTRSHCPALSSTPRLRSPISPALSSTLSPSHASVTRSCQLPPASSRRPTLTLDVTLHDLTCTLTQPCLTFSRSHNA